MTVLPTLMSPVLALTPAIVTWTPKVALVMILCNVIAIAIGKATDYEPGTTVLVKFVMPWSSPTDGDTNKNACYVRCIDHGKFQVFALNCAHLGCPVEWFAQSRLFMCPCHGGVYYEDGSRASGPPPRGLFEYEWRIVDGSLEILAGDLPGLQEGP